MKRKASFIICFILILGCFTLIGCDKQDQPFSEEDSSFDDLVGSYEYVCPNTTATLNENHFIVFEVVEDQLHGRYYGTSDDFDEAREGYYPGYYVTDLLDLSFKDNTFSFELDPDSADMFEDKLGLEILNTADAIEAGYTNWQPGISIDDIRLDGYYEDDLIIINSKYGSREFTKL